MVHGADELGPRRLEMRAGSLNIVNSEATYGAGIEVEVILIGWAEDLHLAAVRKLEDRKVAFLMVELQSHGVAIECNEFVVVVCSGAEPCQSFDHACAPI